jgi:hypothetical protein
LNTKQTTLAVSNAAASIEAMSVACLMPCDASTTGAVSKLSSADAYHSASMPSSSAAVGRLRTAVAPLLSHSVESIIVPIE